MKKGVYSIIFIFCCFLFSCNRQVRQGRHHQIEVVCVDSFLTLGDLFEDFQFIPLENKRECMLSDVFKMIALPEGFVIHDESGRSNVLFFSQEGKFVHRIGDVGRKKEEYISVDDIAVDERAKEIAVMTRGSEIKIYDYSGNYKGTMELKTDAYVNKMCRCDGGYACLLNHNAKGDSILYLYDKDGKLIGKKVPSLPMDIMVSSFVVNPLRTLGEKVLYVDFFTSMFTVVDFDNLEKSDTYQMMTDHVFIYDKEEYENNISNYDCITSGYYMGEKVFGWMNYEKVLSYYSMDLIKDKAYVIPYYDWTPPLLSFYNGYVYTILSQEEIFALAYPKADIITPTMEAFSNAFNLYRADFTMNSNFVILKMKPKNNVWIGEVQ